MVDIRTPVNCSLWGQLDMISRRLISITQSSGSVLNPFLAQCYVHLLCSTQVTSEVLAPALFGYALSMIEHFVLQFIPMFINSQFFFTNTDPLLSKPRSGRPNIAPARIKWWKKWVEYSGGTIFHQNFLLFHRSGIFHYLPE